MFKGVKSNQNKFFIRIFFLNMRHFNEIILSFELFNISIYSLYLSLSLSVSRSQL